jgi:Protein of unknown function (DUF2946)
MPRRFLNRWTLWLLPVIALRALLPTGFMLDATVADGIQVVMCSGAGPVPDLQHGSQSHAHHGDGDHGQDTADNVLCLYALAGAACANVALASAATPPPVAEVFAFYSDANRSAEPFLLDRIRGPPLA